MARKPRIPHVKWRDGKPRFEPGPDIRALGFLSRSLRHEDGRRFTAGEALDWSQDISAEIDKRRREARAVPDAAAPRPRPRAPVRLYSIAMLFEDFFSPAKNPKMAATQTTVGKRRARVLSPSTITDYRQKARVLESHDWDLWHSSVEALDETICYGLYESLWSTRGLATAVGTMRVLSAAISWARRRGRVHLVSNPTSNLQMQMPEPRVRFATREEIRALIDVADTLGRHDAGDRKSVV